MLGSLLCPRVVSCGFRCVLALAVVFAFCPSSKSYADELPDNSAYATTDENETISNDELEPLSNAVSRNELDYIGLVLDGTSGLIDWDLAKPEGASFGFVRAGEINSDGLFVQDDALFSNLECCRDFRVPFSVFVSGVKSSSDIALISDSLLPQLLAIDSPSLYFVLNDSEDNGSVLSAIAALQDEHPSIEFGVGADAAFLRDNASFMAEASIRGLAVDGYASGVDYADYYQLDRLVSVSGCSGSFAVIMSNCLPTEKHAVDDSGAVNEDGVDGSVTEVLTSETTQVESLNVRSSRSVPDGVYEVSSALDDSKALDVAGGSADDCARVQLWGSNSTAAQRFRLSYDEASGFYTIANVGSGKVLDAAAGRWEDGTAVQQYSANGTAAQLWSVEPDGEGYRVCSALNPSQVLDVPGADASDGAGIQLYGANGTAAQRWTLKEVKPVEGGRTIEDGLYRISSTLSDLLVVDIAGGAAEDGANAQLYSWNSTAAQLFYVELDDEGFYSITNLASGKVLDVCGGSFASGTNVQQWTANGTDAQKWAIQPNDDGSYSIVSKLGLNLDVSGALSQDGANLQIWQHNGTLAQSFNFVRASSSRSVPDGVYEVSSALDDSKALDVAGGSADDCARVQLWGSNSTAAQRFRLSYDEASGFYTIANVGSGKVLDAAAGRWEDGTAVQQYSANGTAAQLWSVEPDGEGYRVCSALNPSQVLDVPGADASDGAGIQLYGANGTAAQRWTLKCVSCPVNLHAEYSGNDIMAIDKYNGRLVIALPSSANPDLVALCIDEDFGSPVRVGASRLLEKGDRIALSEAGLGVSPGSETSCAVFDESGESLCTLVVMRSAECASVFLSSDDPQAEGRDYVEASPDHSASAKGNMLMLDASGSMVYEGELDQIKGRGNSTWSADKKPYQIKLKKKADLLQSGNSSNKNKTWVLLANAYDASGIRNVTSYSIAQDIGVKSPIEFRVVDLYYDAEYRGTYLLCEKVQINSGRVDIEDLEESNDEVNGGLDFSDDVEGVNSYGNPIRYTKDVVSPSDITGGYLIEFDGRYASERSWFSISTQWGLTYFVCKSPEGWSYEEADYLSCYVQDAFDAMIDGGTNHRTGKTTGDYIDIASFTSLYWVNEITKNRDGFMFASTFAYKDSDSAAGDSRLIFGPAWDFDLSLGNLDETAGAASDWVANPTGWYTRATGIVPLFMRDPLVLNAMDDSKDIVIAAVRSYLAGEYLTHKYALESSMRLNSVVWGEANESCADVEDWLTKRLDWLSSL